MSSNSIANLASTYLQSVLNSSLQGAGLTANTAGNTLSSTSALTAQLPDNSQLSPFARVLSTLQQLQQSDPTKYQQVTQQIATSLKSAAQNAEADGEKVAAAQLNQLSSDFTNASSTGQLPNMQDLAQAAAGHRHHHHARPTSATSGANSSDTDSTSSSGSANQPLSQLLSAFQGNGSQSEALDPMGIILNSLAGDGLSGFNH